MSKTIKIYIGALVGVIVLIVILDMVREKPVDWRATYSLDDKNPLDLYVFNHEVGKIIPPKRFTRVVVTPFEYIREHDEPINMLIVNQNVYSLVDSMLLDKIKKGSNLWISAENYPKFFTDSLKVQYADGDIGLSLKKLDSLKLTLTMQKWHNKQFYVHPVFNSYAFVGLNKATTSILGKSEMPDEVVYPNFIRVKYGKGTVFLHNQPEVFTNYAILCDQSSADYVAHILSYLPQDKPVVWFVKNQTTNTGQPVNETTLSVIFRYPALRAVWLLFIYGILLYILFNAKRRQRVVPVIKPLKNTTIEFVHTIGNLYFQEGSTSNILEKKIVYFLDRVRLRYYLDTNTLDDRFAEKLQRKSGKEKQLIDDILTCIRNFQKYRNALPSDLVTLNNLIEEFWNE